MGGPVRFFTNVNRSLPTQGPKATPALNVSQQKSTLADLRNVGSSKPMGYLPTWAIVAQGSTVPGLTAELQAKGLKTIYLPSEGGWLFAYDEASLSDHLDRNSAVLEKAGWPTTAREFVRTVSKGGAPHKTKLYDVVADAFGDSKNPGRLDNVHTSDVDWESTIKYYEDSGNQPEVDRLKKLRSVQRLQRGAAASGLPGLFDNYAEALEAKSVPEVTPKPAPQPQPKTFVEITRMDLNSGKPSRWAVVNFSGLKYVNDNYTGGHVAGDAYLEAAESKIREIAGQAGIKEIFIVRDGPNFSIHLPEGVRSNFAMSQIEAAFAQGITFQYEYKGQTLIKTYTPATEGRAKIATAGILAFDVSAKEMSSEAMGRARSQEIYYLNRPEAGRRAGEIFVVDAKYGEYLETLTLKNRLIDRNPRVTATGPNVEPRSQLHNVDQLKLDAENMMKKGKSVRFAFFDGNAIGSWRTFGFVGELFMDAIIEQRIAEAATVLPKGVTIYRHGPGSEEFYLLADGEQYSEAQMQEMAKEFMRSLNEKPLRLKVESNTLEATEMGRRYLEAWQKKNPGKAVPETLEVDVTKAVRGRGGVYHQGITVTMGVGTIKPDSGSAQEAFEKGFHKIVEQGEAAKKLNPKRRNFLVQVDGDQAKVIPLEIDGRDFLEVNRDNIRFVDSRINSNFSVNDLMRLNLGPKSTFKYKGCIYKVSASFDFKGRTAMILYFANGDGIYQARMVYKSNSHLTQRAIPNTAMGWAGKGVGSSESVAYPHEVQRFLEENAQKHKVNLSEAHSEALGEGILRFGTEPEKTYVGGMRKATAPLDIGEFTGTTPDSFKFKPGFEPEIPKNIKPSYQVADSATGQYLDAYVVLSKNKKVSYLFFCDQKGNGALVSYQATDFYPNEYGVNQLQVLGKSEKLIMPIRERAHNIPAGYTGKKAGVYTDATPWTNQLPPVKELLRKVRGQENSKVIRIKLSAQEEAALTREKLVIKQYRGKALVVIELKPGERKAFYFSENLDVKTNGKTIIVSKKGLSNIAHMEGSVFVYQSPAEMVESLTKKPKLFGEEVRSQTFVLDEGSWKARGVAMNAGINPLQKPVFTDDRLVVETKPSRAKKLAAKYDVPVKIAKRALAISQDSKARLKAAKTQAMKRIDRLNKSAQEKARMKAEAAKGWDAAIAEVEEASVKKAVIDQLKKERKVLRKEVKTLKKQRAPKSEIRAKAKRLAELDNVLDGKVKKFAKAHGQMLALLLTMDVIRHWSEVKTGNLGGVVQTGVGSVAGYGMFVGTEKTIGVLTGISKSSALTGAGTIIPAAHSAYAHRNHFTSVDSDAAMLAGIDVVKEGIAGYLSTKAMIAVTAATAETGPFSLLFGLGAASVTYIATGKLAEVLGYDQFLEKRFTRAEIKDAFRDLSYGGTKLVVKRGRTNTPYFNNKDVEIAKDVKISRAQQTLMMLTAMKNYFNMSTTERLAFAADKNNHAIITAFNTLFAVEELHIDDYSDLSPEAFDAIVKSVGRFYQQDKSPGQYRKVKVRLRTKQEKIYHPLTNEIVGLRTVYRVTVVGQKHQATLGWNGVEWEPIEGTKRKKTFKTKGEIVPVGDPNKLVEAQVLQKGMVANVFTISLPEMIGLGISIPFDQLKRFPVVMEGLAKNLSMLGYKVEDEFLHKVTPGSRAVTPGSLYKAYYQFCKDQGFPFEGQENYNPDFALLPSNKTPKLDYRGAAWILIELDPEAKAQVEVVRQEMQRKREIKKITDMFKVSN